MVGTVPYTSLTLSREVPTYVGTPASDSATDRLAAHASEREERESARGRERAGLPVAQTHNQAPGYEIENP